MTWKGTRHTFAGKHVLITGGSEGVGLALAKLLTQQKARVSLIARTLNKLEAAKVRVLEAAGLEPHDNSVFIHTADVTQQQQVFRDCPTPTSNQKLPLAANEPSVSVHYFANAVSTLLAGYFHDLDAAKFGAQMQLNYMGTVYAIKAVYGSMIQRNQGHICIISSTMGLLGFIGYAAYSPTKFALRGLAECLRNELQGTQVLVSIAYPGDINTPGYAKENQAKPWETAKLSEGTLYSPEVVAQSIMRGMQRKDFIVPNLVLKLGLLQRICAGLVPRSFPGVLWDMLLGFLAPIIGAITAAEHDAVARQGAKRRYERFWRH
eukprot:jgi/Chrzof1/6966/Cz02g05230.t1